MAIDSREKRASAIGILPLVVYPVADGTIDNFDRAQVTWIYAGIVYIGAGDLPSSEPEPEPQPTPEVIATIGGAPLRRKRVPAIVLPNYLVWMKMEDEEILIS